ncbi:MAG: polymer-forming cytoskeletal protein [bacterium]
MNTRLIPILISLLAATSAYAFEFQRVDTYALGPDDTAVSQMVIAANKANIEGRIADDLFLLANDAFLSGSLENDAWLAANTLRVTGRVHDHLRLVANTATLSGTVSNSLSAVANSLQLTRESRVDGSVNAVAGSATLEGAIGGNVRLVGEQVTLAGVIAGNARVYANDIVIMPGAVINGDLVYTSEKELVLDEKVQLRGQLIRKEITQPTPEMPRIPPTQVVMVYFYLFVAALMVGIPFAGLLPRLTGNAVRVIRHSSLKCALTGMLCFCLFPMVSTLVLLTLVGIPLGIALLVVYAFMLYLSKIVVAIAVGGTLMRWRGPQPFGRVMLALSLGLVLLYTATTLPIVGVGVWFIITFIGTGGLVLGGFQTQAAPEPPPLEHGKTD